MSFIGKSIALIVFAATLPVVAESLDESGMNVFLKLKQEIQNIPTPAHHDDDMNKVIQISKKISLSGGSGLEFESTRVLYFSLQLMFVNKCALLHCPDYDSKANYHRNLTADDKALFGKDALSDSEFLLANEQIGKCMRYEEIISRMEKNHIRFAIQWGLLQLEDEEIEKYIIPLIWVYLDDPELIRQVEAQLQEELVKRKQENGNRNPIVTASESNAQPQGKSTP